MKLITSFIVLLVIACAAVYVTVDSHPRLYMEPTDRYEVLLPSSEKAIYYAVKVSDYDTSMCRTYANEIFHREVPDSIGVSQPVQMSFFFYKESNLRDLETEELMAMGAQDPNALQRLRKLQVDTSGYGVVRFSEVYAIFGRDSLYGVKGKIMVPGHGSQIRDFIRPTTQSKH